LGGAGIPHIHEPISQYLIHILANNILPSPSQWFCACPDGQTDCEDVSGQSPALQLVIFEVCLPETWQYA
jgi:hypothetical protein